MGSGLMSNITLFQSPLGDIIFIILFYLYLNEDDNVMWISQ